MNKYVLILLSAQSCYFNLGAALAGAGRVGSLARTLASQQVSSATPSEHYFLSKDRWPNLFGRRAYVTYSDAASGSSISKGQADAQDIFVQDEQWREQNKEARRVIQESSALFNTPNEYSRLGMQDYSPASSSSVDYAQAFATQEPAVRVDEDALQKAQVTSWHEYEPEEYALLNPLQKKLISEADYNAIVEEYNNLKDVKIYKFTYTVDDQPVVGFALLPTQEPATGKHPLVVALRGGFNGEGPFHEWAKTDLPYIMRHFAFYAKNGYAVLTSQYRGADGNTNKDQFGGDDVNDVLGLFDIAREMGNIDTQNISLSVFSRGTVMGYKTLQALEDRTPIKAMVIKGGISDLETFVQEDPKYIVPILKQARPDFDERKDEITKDISFVRGAEVLKGIPTLVMHNSNDNVVPVKLTHNLVRRLQEAGVEHDVKFFPGKHHQILEFNDDVQDLTIKWLDTHTGSKKIKASL